MIMMAQREEGMMNKADRWWKDFNIEELRKAVFNSIAQSGYWMLSKKITQAVGILEAALLADLLEKERYFAKIGRLEKGGWFYMTQGQRQCTVCKKHFTIHKQVGMIEVLRNSGLIEVKRRGLPCRQYFRINYNVVMDLLNQPYSEGVLGSMNSEDLVTGNFDNYLSVNQIINNNRNNKKRDNEKRLKHLPKGRCFADSSNPKPPLSSLPNHGSTKSLKDPPKVPVPSEDPTVRQSKQIWDYWHSLGYPLPGHRLQSKTGKEAFAEICKRLNNGSSVEDMTAAIGRYHKLISSPGTILNSNIAGHCVPLRDFFRFSPYLRKLISQQKNGLKISSWYEECRRLPEAKLLQKYAASVPRKQSRHPEVTDRIEALYAKEVLGTKRADFTDRDHNVFAICTDRLMVYKAKVEEEYKTAIHPFLLADLLIEGLTESFSGTVTVGNLISNYTFHHLLPTKLAGSALMYQLQAGVKLDRYLDLDDDDGGAGDDYGREEG